MIFARAMTKACEYAHPTEDGGPPAIFNNEHSQIGLKFSLLALNLTLEPPGVTSRNFSTCPEACMTISVQLWGPVLKCVKSKTSKIRRDFGQL